MSYRDDLDKEANLFARCLLIPEELVRKEMRKLNHLSPDLLDDENCVVIELAKKFDVSQAMMVLRLEEIGLVK